MARNESILEQAASSIDRRDMHIKSLRRFYISQSGHGFLYSAIRNGTA